MVRLSMVFVALAAAIFSNCFVDGAHHSSHKPSKHHHLKGVSTLSLAATKSGNFPVIAPGDWVEPSKAVYAMKFLTLGDFGATTEAQGAPDKAAIKAGTQQCQFANKAYGSRVNEKEPVAPCGSSEWWRQWHAQAALAYLMGVSAETQKPLAVITQGDNFYWDGVASKDSEMFKVVFENIYSHPKLMDIPWLMCLGNHDVGGSAFICGTDPGTAAANDEWHVACESADETTAAMNAYFNAQKNYVSPSKRWTFKGPYYKTSFKSGKISVDIFTVDTNVASVHGLKEICCQCFGYASAIPMSCPDKKPGKTNAADCGVCKNVERGNKFCAPNAVYDACAQVIQGWFDTAMSQLSTELTASTATWKIVNTHYNPLFHFGNEPAYNQILTAISGKVNAYLCGHTHAPSHDYQTTTKVNYIMDGSGGGITAEGAGSSPELQASKNFVPIWSGGGVYAFTEIFLSEQWMKVNFVAPDDAWVWGSSFTPGGAKSIHCALIPVDGGKPMKCSEASKWVRPISAVNNDQSSYGSGSTTNSTNKSTTNGKSGTKNGTSSDSSKTSGAPAVSPLSYSSSPLILSSVVAVLCALIGPLL